MMALLIPFTVFMTAFLGVQIYNKGIRESILQSTILFFLFITLSTQLLSFFEGVNFRWMVIFWILVFIFLILWIFLSVKLDIVLERAGRFWRNLSSLSFLDWSILALIGLILMVTLVVALVSPPNNVDSLIYHMARVSQWIQRESVEYYPTSILRQNNFPPLAEYAILHLQILSKADVYANLVQWYSFFVSIIGATLISKELGLPRLPQLLSGFLVATTPMAILQSSSTQNDLVLSMLILGFVYYLVKLSKEGKGKYALLGGIALGLALFTKGTAYIFCAGIGVALTLSSLIKPEPGRSLGKRLKLISLFSFVVLVALVVNGGFYLRNINAYGVPIAGSDNPILNGEISLTTLGTNLVRNFAVHLGVPFPEINARITGLMINVLGNSAQYPPATFTNHQFEVNFVIHEDIAGNLPQLGLFVASMLLSPILSREDGNDSSSLSIALGLGILLSFILFSGLVRWQSFVSRLHLPLFFLASPLIVNVFSHELTRYKTITFGAMVLLVVYSVPFLLLNSSRPLLENRSKLGKRAYKVIQSVELYKYQNIFETEREQMYFANDIDLYDDYLEVINYIKGENPERVGLYLERPDWEYPYWVLAGSHAHKQGPSFEHVGVENETRSIRKHDYVMPSFVIATKDVEQGRIGSSRYQIELETEFVDVYRKASSD